MHVVGLIKIEPKAIVLVRCWWATGAIVIVCLNWWAKEKLVVGPYYLDQEGDLIEETENTLAKESVPPVDVVLIAAITVRPSTAPAGAITSTTTTVFPTITSSWILLLIACPGCGVCDWYAILRTVNEEGLSWVVELINWFCSLFMIHSSRVSLDLIWRNVGEGWYVVDGKGNVRILQWQAINDIDYKISLVNRWSKIGKKFRNWIHSRAIFKNKLITSRKLVQFIIKFDDLSLLVLVKKVLNCLPDINDSGVRFKNGLEDGLWKGTMTTVNFWTSQSQIKSMGQTGQLI